MKTGLSFFFMATDRDGTDQEIYREELALADLAEPLGFDSVWGVEHHFTEYSMIPNPMQFLSYMAGRTKRIDLGSMVMVLPWHNPVRLASEIGMLDNLSEGRFQFGIGRGLGRLEFEGLGASMDTSREVFDEAAETILAALESGFVEADGEFVRAPKRELRPRPTKTFRGRTYGAAVSPESVQSMARHGAGLIIIPQKPWDTVAGELELYREAFAQHHPDRETPAPIVACHVYCDSDAGRAAERGPMFNQAYYHRVMDHYGLSGDGFEKQKGYSYYASVASRINRSGKDDAADFYSNLHVYGTPEQCLEKIEWIKNTVQCDTFLSFFSYSGMPFEESRRNLELFSEKVRPVIQAMD
ncbi:LLM class flavin-dependent oxidoreductase [Dactylosporangium sp. NPDC051484]|uniref:LLM class flavin-dependent oxidoreductase n=1 Tax=Dactylosporangium sp. NPDC051484 TaxID=3154942 RepID=UPI0034504CED